MASEPVRITEPIRFGEDFELDVRAYELRRSGMPLKLERIPMELLVLLVERRGELVTRDQIVERIWGKDVFLDTDNSINAAARKVRQVLKDDPEQPRFVLTVMGKGYRFVAPVEEPPVPGPVVSPDAEAFPSADNLLGKKVSHYRIVQMLGGGGMGVVYKAEDLKLGRQVALKFLPGELASDPVAFERLQREARAASALDHPNICSIYQLGEHEGQPFIVMQFLEGQTLREWIENSTSLSAPSRIQEMVSLAIQVTDGLEAAHEKGIIHRDIKPANIFVTSRGQAKILDFGVAKFVDAAEFGEAKNPAAPLVADAGIARAGNVHLTRTGASIGTPSYLSPEQIRREKLDARTDLFSFGLVLYEMATGQRAFSGETATVIRDAVLNLPPFAARQLNRDIPLWLEKVIDKSLQKDPDQRYQTARGLRADLLAESERKREASWLSRLAAWTTAAFLIVALFLAVTNVGSVGKRLLHRNASTDLATQFNPRPSVAVLGFKNLSGLDDVAWISTALSEMLGAELAAGQHLRVVPAENVARMRLDLSLSPAESYGPDTLTRIRNHLNADMVVLGSYFALRKDAAGKIRIDVQLQDTKSGETVAVVSQDGTQGGLADLVSRGGADLRQRLGIGGIPAGETRQVLEAVPANLEAARLYSEGLAMLEKFDALAARGLLEKAVAADPNHALSHSALAEAWSALGYLGRAREEAKKALDLSSNLSREGRLLIEGRYREREHDYPAAIEIFRTLRNFFPDDLDHALRLASAQNRGGQAKDALQTVARMRNLPLPQSQDARIDLAEAEAADVLGDLKHLQKAASECAKKARAQGSLFIVGKAREKEAWAWRQLGDLDKATALLAEARDLFASAANPNATGVVLFGMGAVLENKGDYEGARKAYEQSLGLFRQAGSEANAAIADSGIGNLLYEQGKLEEAKRYYEEALKVSREVGNQPGIAAQLGNMANVLTGLGDLAGATQFSEQSLQAYREVGDKRGEAVTLSGLCGLLVYRGELLAARRACEQSLTITQDIGLKSVRADDLQSIATIDLVQDQLPEARAAAEQAVMLRREMQDQANLARSQIALAEIALEEGKTVESEALLRNAAPVFDQQEIAEGGSQSAAVLSRALSAQGSMKEAQLAAERAVALSRKTGDRASRFGATIVSADVEAQSGHTAAALKVLEGVRAEARRYGYVSVDLEVRLHLGDLELRSGKTAAGRARLQQLQGDAHNKGFLLIARKATTSLNK